MAQAAAAAAAAEKLKSEAESEYMKKNNLVDYVITSFINDFYPNDPELTTQQLIDKEKHAQAARRSFQYIMGGVFFADSIENIPVFGKILALVFEMVKSMMGILGGLSATLLPIPFGVLPFGSFIGAFVGWLVSMIFFLPYAAMSFSQKQFSDTAVGLFSMIPIVGLPIANMFKSGVKSGSKVYYLSSKATKEVMALFEKIGSVARTATEHSFAPGDLRKQLFNTEKKLHGTGENLGKSIGDVYKKLEAAKQPVEVGEHTNPFGMAPPARVAPPPSAPPANAVQPTPSAPPADAAPPPSARPANSARPKVPQPLIRRDQTVPPVFGPGQNRAATDEETKWYDNIAKTNGRGPTATQKQNNRGGKRFTRRHAIRRKCRTVKHRQSRKH